MKSIDKLSVDLPLKLQKKIPKLVEAQQKTAQKVWEDIVKDAPIKTGQYVSSIKIGATQVIEDKITTKIYTDMNVETIDGKRYNLGRLLENGTKSHKIVAVRSNVLSDGVNFFGKVVNHPGTVAQPHFQPSLQKNKFYYKKEIGKAIIGG